MDHAQFVTKEDKHIQTHGKYKTYKVHLFNQREQINKSILYAMNSSVMSSKEKV